MNTCDTCKQWQKDPPTPGMPEVLRGGHCQAFGLMEGDDFFCDSSPDYGELYTGPKFGCVHWKAKP